VEAVGGELSITSADGLPGLILVDDYQVQHGGGTSPFGLPDNSWSILSWSANEVLSEPLFGLKEVNDSGGILMSPHPGTLTGRGKVYWTMTGTDVLKGQAANPAMLFGGSGHLTLTKEDGSSECFVLNTHKFQVSLNDVMSYEFVGEFFKADYRDMGAEGRITERWPLDTIQEHAGCSDGSISGEHAWGTSDMTANVADWAGDNYGGDLGLPAGYDWELLHIATTKRSNAWHLAVSDMSTSGNAEVCQALTMCLRGDTSFRIAGTNVQHDVYGIDARPALGVSGSGKVYFTNMSSGDSICIPLSAGTPQIAIDPGVRYEVSFEGEYMEIDHGPTMPTSTVDVRWPHSSPTTDSCQ